MYSKFLSGTRTSKRVCPIKADDLNFLKEGSNLYSFPYFLYSAGQSMKMERRPATLAKDTFLHRDRRKTVMVGDSGGFQIQTDKINFKGDKTVELLLRWLEEYCDWSMILDFPVGGINMGTVDKHYDRLISEGHDIKQFCLDIGLNPNDYQKLAYATCLYQTRLNNDYFVKNRVPGKTNFLNVIQGRTNLESSIWYESVKDYPFEAWAFASNHKDRFSMTMKRIIDMKYDGNFIGKDWLHILGVGKLPHGCIYTTIQNCIREDKEYGNPNFTISYDVSSAFASAARGNVFLGYIVSPTDAKKAVYTKADKIDGSIYFANGSHGNNLFIDECRRYWNNFDLDSHYLNVFVETEISKQLKMKDICVNTENVKSSSWDITSYAMIMNHNLQVQLEAMFKVQDLYAENSSYLPIGLLNFKELIPKIYNAKSKDEAYKIIDENVSHLDIFQSIGTAKGGVADIDSNSVAHGIYNYTLLEADNLGQIKGAHKGPAEPIKEEMKLFKMNKNTIFEDEDIHDEYHKIDKKIITDTKKDNLKISGGLFE